MSGHLLLVTGSRALDDTPAANEWAQNRVRAAVQLHQPRVIVAGDARGPDAHAIEFAQKFGIPYERWCLDGWITGRERRRWWPEGEPRPSSDPKHWPLVRNRRMVETVAELSYVGTSVFVLALTAPWAKTRGTAFTASLASGHNLVTLSLVCPAELGPKVRDAAH